MPSADLGDVAIYVVTAAGSWPAASATEARPVVGELFGVWRDGEMARPVLGCAPQADLLALEDDLRHAGHGHGDARILSRLALRHLGADQTRESALTGSLVEFDGDEALEVPVDLLKARQIIRDYQLSHYLPGDTVGDPFDGP